MGADNDLFPDGTDVGAELAAASRALAGLRALFKAFGADGRAYGCLIVLAEAERHVAAARAGLCEASGGGMESAGRGGRWRKAREEFSAGFQGGGSPPAIAAAAIGAESKDGLMEQVAAFLGEAARMKPGERVPASDLYAAYCRWCVEQKRGLATQTAFGRCLTELKVAPVKSHGRTYRFLPENEAK